MRTIAREKAFQITLRNCSEGGGKVNIYMILVKGKYRQYSTYIFFFSFFFFLAEVSASLEVQISPWKILAIF